jgi:hypothetical protein
MVRVKPTWSSQANERGQAVLLAALVLVVALLPIIAAYLQLGYTGEAPVGIASDTEAETERLLERTVQEETSDIPADYRWSERRDAAERVRERLEPAAEALEQSRLDNGVTQQLRYNDSRADDWMSDNCPSGPDRQFGSCDAIDGIVVQQRGGRTHILAIAIDLLTTAPEYDSTVTTVIRTQAGGK